MTETADYFLQLIQRSRKGRLKIYVGMIAGVGKTYRMLQEAHQLLQANVNVKIGFIETHGRAETHALVKGIPTIPMRKVYYKGKELEEMDLDAILTERPEVVIVDELAHTNIPGSRNEKRWQDVYELVQAGINVITAFNVQHLESLNDKVQSITGIEVKERIPDIILKEADEVVTIDLPADDLIQRLKEGKIYRDEKIQQALDNFFQADKILQLRELALRQVAKNLEHKIDAINTNRPVVERFMACISTNDIMARKVIRKTARLANNYNADWLVVYVKSKSESAEQINSRVQTKLFQNLKLAASLGAKVVQYQTYPEQEKASGIATLLADGVRLVKSDKKEIPDIIFKAAQENKATNIVIGRPNQSVWRTLTGRNYFRKLVGRIAATDIDLIVVT